MSQYPPINAGTRITTSLLNAMIPVVIRKPSFTPRASTTTLVDDPDLTYSLAANSMYYVEFFVRFGTPGVATTSGLKTAWTVPSGASGLKSAVGPGSAASDVNGDNLAGRWGVHGFATIAAYGTRAANSSQMLAVETAVVTTTNAGTCALQWAQNTSNATPTQVFSDSVMRITQWA